MADFIKVQKLSNTIRVIIEPVQLRGRTEYHVAAQQYIPGSSYGWEVHPDGWRNTMATTSPTLEGAKRLFEQMVSSEQRWLEQRA